MTARRSDQHIPTTTQEEIMGYATYETESKVASFARHVAEHLAEHFPAEHLPQQQVLCLAEEAGEFVGAYRRWAGMARRQGSFEDVRAELADVVITAYVTARVLGFDLDEAIREKAGVISTRGWRDTPQPKEIGKS
jgi:NTP pyrophosphatase (non-canonical NTP hydrolase)